MPFTDTPSPPEERLRHLREARSLTVRDVAKLSQGAFTASQVSNLETGVSSWAKSRIETLQGLARAFDMSVSDLIAYVESKPVKDSTAISDLYKPIPTYDLTYSTENKGVVIKVADESVLLPDTQHLYDLYKVVHPGETIPRVRLLVRKIAKIKVNQTILCQTPDWGVSVCLVAVYKDKMVSLEDTLGRKQIFKEKQVKVLGLVVAETRIFKTD
jgi:transcriptional regulator with XRE-family HTH domain